MLGLYYPNLLVFAEMETETLPAYIDFLGDKPKLP